MSAEKNTHDPVQVDIDQIAGLGMPSLLGMYSDEEGLFRSRRAYDTTWGHLHDIAFMDATDTDPETTPHQKIIEALDKVLDACVEPASTNATFVAFTGHLARQDRNAYIILLDDNAQYFYETKFIATLTDLCKQGDIKANDTINTPEKTGTLLLNYLAITAWSVLSGEQLPPNGIDELKLGMRIIVYGAGPTPDS